MELKEIQEKLTEAHSIYVERTGKQPLLGPSLRIEGGGKPNVSVTPFTDDGGEFITSSADTIEAALDGFFAKLKAMPTGEERAVQEFQRDLGKLIDKGNKLGIPVEFVNPLTEMARKLAENAITDQREVSA